MLNPKLMKQVQLRSERDMNLDRFPTGRFTYAYKAGIRAALAGKPLTACHCRTLVSIADWRMGWRDATLNQIRHPKRKEVKPDRHSRRLQPTHDGG